MGCAERCAAREILPPAEALPGEQFHRNGTGLVEFGNILLFKSYMF